MAFLAAAGGWLEMLSLALLRPKVSAAWSFAHWSKRRIFERRTCSLKEAHLWGDGDFHVRARAVPCVRSNREAVPILRAAGSKAPSPPNSTEAHAISPPTWHLRYARASCPAFRRPVLTKFLRRRAVSISAVLLRDGYCKDYGASLSF